LAVLMVLAAARAVSTVCREGSPYVMYGAWVAMFCAFLDPQKYVGVIYIYRGLYNHIDMESAMHTAWIRWNFPHLCGYRWL
jgi:hypothetical protein